MHYADIPTLPILILGGDSSIGRCLKNKLDVCKYASISTTRKNELIAKQGYLYLDLQDENSIKHVCRQKYSCAVICAGMTKIDFCERYPQHSRLINVHCLSKVIDELMTNETHLIFISTNLVFNGELVYPTIEDKREPTTEYGKQKLEIEKYLSKYSDKATIIRFGKILDKNVKLFVEWRLKLQRQEPVLAYSNKYLAPISMDYATNILMGLIDRKITGIFQVSSRYQISYADAGLYLAKTLKAKENLILPIKDPSEDKNHQKNSTLSFTICLPNFSAPDPYSALSSLL